MTTTTVPERAEARIRRAAVELMGRKGIAGTTTQDISRRARCSQAAIYKYWDGKETLAREILDGAYTDLVSAMRAEAQAAADPAERPIRVLLGLVRFARQFPAEYAFLFQVFHSDYARWIVSLPKPRDVVVEELERAAKAGHLPEGQLATKAAMLLGMAIRVAFFERQNLLDGSAEAVENTLWRGAAAVLES